MADDLPVIDPPKGFSLIGQFNPIGTAEARTPKTPKPQGPNDIPMENWPATPEEFQTKFGRAPQSDTEKKFYSDEAPPQLPSWRDHLDQMTQGASDTGAQNARPGGWRGMLESALSPITNLPETYRKEVQETTGQMGRGVGQITGSAEKPEDQSRVGQIARGVGNVGLGALGYAFSPLTAAERSIVSQPLQNVTGLPREYTEFAMNLGIPGLGLPRAPGLAGRQTAAQAAKALGTSPPPGPISRALQTPEKLLSPETVGPSAEDAAALIREHTGQAARNIAIDANNFEGFQRTASAMAPAEKINLQNYIDGGKTATAPATVEQRAMADSIRGAMEDVKKEVQSLPKHVDQAFRENYFPHFWKDPDAARELMRRGGIGKAGSSASLQARTMPTIEDGIRAGLVPKWDNPVEASMRYITSMRQMVARERILQAGQDAGTVIRAQPEAVGASGSGAMMRGIPPGYEQLTGPGGQGLWAPANWARIYNNWLSAGFHATEEGGNMYDAVRRASNATSQSLLALSGYHGFTMAEAGLSTELSRAVAAGRGKDARGLLKSFARYPTAPVSYAMRGARAKDIYLHPGATTAQRGVGIGASAVSQQDREIVDLLTKGGARFVGKEHALDFEQSRFGDYVRSFRRGGMAQIGREYGSLYERGGIAGGTAKAALSTLGRTLETIQRPLFQKYIPAMKNGATTALMGDWLKANPGASQTEKLAQARRIVDSVDNRFGEMIQDNIFWGKGLKQTAMLGMLSYSWNMGGIREIGGGIRDIARTAASTGAMTRKGDYVLSTAITWGLLAGTYQYLKTGQAPWDSETPYQDMVAPRTGGTVEIKIPQGVSPQEALQMAPELKNFRQQGRTWYADQPERIIPPGIMKDVFGYYEHPMQEVYNKMNPMAKMGMEVFKNANWRNDPIFQPKTMEEQKVWDSLPVWLGNAVDYAINTAGPISFQNIAKGRGPGTGLSPAEQTVGIRQANRYLYDPFYNTRQRDYDIRRWQQMKSREQKERQRKEQYGGVQ